MKIALIGYGKMGHMIEEIAVQRGHEIVLRINIDNTEEFTAKNISVAYPDYSYLVIRKIGRSF